jgi:pyruvate dehydrogenase E1 component alpha subunit
MLLIRRFEQAAAKAYTERKIGGFLHLYIGQEAVASGVIAAAEDKDHVIVSYRDHAHYLAKGGSAKKAMAELYGKETGCSKGRGGSMHFFDKSINFHGGHGIVGAHVPIASGLAFASKYEDKKEVALCFLGEGACSIGPFHEGLCLAALWKLPVVFIIENNGYSMGTAAKRHMAVEDASIRALAYPMARHTVEGSDVVECFNAAKEAIDRARNESLPTLLEFKTYRYRGHSMADPGKYRTKEEVKYWKQNKDPLEILKARIEKSSTDSGSQLDSISKSVDEEVDDAVSFAENSPSPSPDDLFNYTYVD